MQAVLRTLVMSNESVSDEEFFCILNLFPDYEQFGKQTIEFKITLEGTKSWRKVRLPAILSLSLIHIWSCSARISYSDISQ